MENYDAKDFVRRNIKEKAPDPKPKASLKERLSKLSFKGLFKRAKGQTTKKQRIITSGTIKSLLETPKPKSKRRVLSPQDKLRLQRLKVLRGQQGRNNRDLRDRVLEHDSQRQSILRESALRNQKLSPNTRAMLERVREIQTRGQRADDRQQRIQAERRIIQNATDILRTPSLFDSKNTRGKIDFTGVPEGNILLASNVFLNNPENNILKPKRRNILDSQENTLDFFI